MQFIQEFCWLVYTLYSAFWLNSSYKNMLLLKKNYLQIWINWQMWSFDNIQVLFALTRQGFVRPLYLPYLHRPFRLSLGNVNCTGDASGFSWLSVPSLFGTCRTSGVPLVGQSSCVWSCFLWVFFFPTLINIWELHVCAVLWHLSCSVPWLRELPCPCLPEMPTGRWCIQGCSRVKREIF